MNEAELFIENIPTLTDAVYETPQTLATFVGLSGKERVNFIAALLEKQFGWLRRGVDMTGPVGVFKHGALHEPDWTDYSEQKHPQASSAGTVRLTPQQLDGFPYIRLYQFTREGYAANQHDTTYDHSRFNYFHMYEVSILTPFGDKKAGDLVDAKVGSRTLQFPISQKQIDENTEIVIRVGVSI